MTSKKQRKKRRSPIYLQPDKPEEPAMAKESDAGSDDLDALMRGQKAREGRR